MGSLAAAYQRNGQSKKARALQAKSFEHMKESVGVSHRVTLLTQLNLADFQVGHSALRRNRKGIRYREEALKELRKAYGEKNLKTLWCMTQLAGDYFICGSLEKAERLQETVLKELVLLFGPDHEYTVQASAALAQTRKGKAIRKAVYWWAPKQLLK